jgi:hypothetical protein
MQEIESEGLNEVSRRLGLPIPSGFSSAKVEQRWVSKKRLAAAVGDNKKPTRGVAVIGSGGLCLAWSRLRNALNLFRRQRANQARNHPKITLDSQPP